MQTHGLNFVYRPQTVIMKIMMYICSCVTLSMYEELTLIVKSIESEVGKPTELIEKIRIHGKRKEALIEISREMSVLPGVQSLDDIFPSVKLFSYLNPLRPKAKKLFKRLNSVLEDIINQQENKLPSRNDGDNHRQEEKDNMTSRLSFI
ncbi:hypothetical protein M9H77_12867 [Catharanthus roseus]|uniref:Uncharacterized protein n=1 Tax=Catharanthus roseus TaxID=4058 RepID=A0ACC0BIU9_CATRO|nr:hypothetical protein M9H77_12867 [Catharanthus roseus]